MKYKYITTQLLRNGVIGIDKWSKEEFVIVCMDEFSVCKRTAERVYDEYHRLVGSPDNGGMDVCT